MSSFAEDLQHVSAFQLFFRALPSWCHENNTSVTFKIVGTGDEAEIGFGMPAKDISESMFQSLMARLGEEQRLMDLTLLVDEMRNVGVGSEILDPMIIEATELAHRLHPGVPFKIKDGRPSVG